MALDPPPPLTETGAMAAAFMVVTWAGPCRRPADAALREHGFRLLGRGVFRSPGTPS